jgi:uncharacterized protein (TIGR03435 family)
MGPLEFSMRGRLLDFIVNAYEVESFQVADIPKWAEDEFFDIQARAETEADPHQIRAMLQTLLADRFQLKLHHETRTMAGYVLSVDKNGPKLPPLRTGMPLDSNGSIQIGGGQFLSRGATMNVLARVLTIELGKPVVDRTDIKGNYDFTLHFDEANDDLKTDATADAAAEGSVFTAVREIGLRVQAGKIPIDVLVIDGAERPSSN